MFLIVWNVGGIWSNMQKIIGLSLSIMATLYVSETVAFDLKLIVACILIGVGGVIYGDVE